MGLERAGMKTVAFCEIDPFCRAILETHWPEVPICDDIRSFSGGAFRGVDLVCGGTPCQPASVAGKRLGSADPRWLWPEFLRVCREVAPSWVVAENPLGIVGLEPHGLDWICEELEADGYEVCPVVVGADDVGAPHRRKRVWIVAHAGGERYQRDKGAGRQAQRRPEHPSSELAHADLGRCERERIGGLREGVGEHGEAEERGDYPDRRYRWPSRPGEPQYEWEPPRAVHEAQSGLGHSADGIPVGVAPRLRRKALRALGNSVVPQITEAIGRAILRCEASV